MSSKVKRDQELTGYVETTPRGFRQDADNAIKGDLVRGLIEAMTNSDDAYGDRRGKILVSVSAKASDGSFKVVVSDRACGICPSDMHRKLLKAGLRTSGHEKGHQKRGNRGRGAKDLSAFGMVEFDTIVGDAYAHLSIERGGLYHGPFVSRVTSEDRKKFGIPKADGTVTTITCRAGTKRSRFDTFKRRLTNAVPLRKLLQDPNREVLFQYAEEKPVPLKCLPPSIAATIFEGTVKVGSYGEAKVTIFESAEPFNDTPSDISRLGGIVITSERACHESTLFSLEGNPYASKLFGYCDFPVIDALAREFDDRDDRNEPQDPENPCPIVRRDRDGLEHFHPAYAALRAAIEPVLNDYVKQAAAKNVSSQKQSDAARRRNQNTANVLARWMVEQENEFDVETEPTVDETFRIIPPLKYIEIGSEVVLSVRVGGLNEDARVSARLQSDCDEGVEAMLSTREVQMEQQECEAGTFHRGTFKVTGGSVTGVLYIEGRLLLNGVDTPLTAEATIKIEEPREVLPPEPPAEFMFDRRSYTVQAGKKKRLLLLAPADVVEKYGADVRLQSSEAKGVSVGGGNRARLQRVDEGWYEAEVLVEGRQLGAQVKLTARIEGHVYRAETNIRVREDDMPSFKIEPKALPGNVRAAWIQSQDGVVVEVNATHPAAARYFGPENDGFPYQESLAARMLIAEVVADEAVRVQIKKASEKQDQQLDAEAFYAKRLILLADLLPRLHREQLGELDVAAINALLQPERRALASVG
jgi:hypothetical protein